MPQFPHLEYKDVDKISQGCGFTDESLHNGSWHSENHLYYGSSGLEAERGGGWVENVFMCPPG